MLKIRYSIETGILSGWTDADVDFDSLQPREGEETTILDAVKPEPSADYEYWYYNGSELIRSGKPIPEPTPPLSTHPAWLDDINPGAVKPATVTRIFLTEAGFTTLWNGKEWSYDCYVTQSVVDEWQAGKIAVGDFVLVHFLESDVTKPIVTHKIFRTW